MDNELRQRIKKLAAVECPCVGDRYPSTKDDYCARCNGIGKKWYPLWVSYHMVEEDGQVSDEVSGYLCIVDHTLYVDDRDVIAAVEQCLSLAGSWFVRFGAETLPKGGGYIYNAIFDRRAMRWVNEDRLTAAVECLEAINDICDLCEVAGRPLTSHCDMCKHTHCDMCQQTCGICYACCLEKHGNPVGHEPNVVWGKD